MPKKHTSQKNVYLATNNSVNEPFSLKITSLHLRYHVLEVILRKAKKITHRRSTGANKAHCYLLKSTLDV